MRESVWKAGREDGTAAARKARTGRTGAIDSHRQEHPYTRMDRADVGRYLAGDLTLILLLGWLFYDSFVSVIVLFPGMLWMLQEQKRTWRRRRKREMQRQFLDAIQMMAASLQSGYSVENAVRASAKELEKLYPRDTFIVLEFQNMALQLDRNRSVESLLQDLGGSAFLEGDCLVVQGGTPLTGGAARSYGDHRIAMAAAVAASLCTGPVRLIGAEAVTKSYPRFWQDYQSLGGIWEEIS